MKIGNIDDDLIQEASEAHGYKIRKISFIRLAGMVACLCLIYAAILLNMHRDVIYYNTAPAPLAAKVLVPSDENSTIFTLTYHELFDYYGLEPFSDVLSGLRRLEQTHFYVYQSLDGTMCDTNILNYYSDNGEQMLIILLSKNGSDRTTQDQDLKSQGSTAYP